MSSCWKQGCYRNFTSHIRLGLEFVATKEKQHESQEDKEVESLVL